jgi:hypothetical protein
MGRVESMAPTRLPLLLLIAYLASCALYLGESVCADDCTCCAEIASWHVHEGCQGSCLDPSRGSSAPWNSCLGAVCPCHQLVSVGVRAPLLLGLVSLPCHPAFPAAFDLCLTFEILHVPIPSFAVVA